MSAIEFFRVKELLNIKPVTLNYGIPNIEDNNLSEDSSTSNEDSINDVELVKDIMKELIK